MEAYTQTPYRVPCQNATARSCFIGQFSGLEAEPVYDIIFLRKVRVMFCFRHLLHNHTLWAQTLSVSEGQRVHAVGTDTMPAWQPPRYVSITIEFLHAGRARI